MGRSNVGKSSLINALTNSQVASSSKNQGKTQALEFFLLKEKKDEPKFFLVDSPGFGYVKGPIVLRKKFKYLLYSYLNYGVRINQIVYLVNGEHGLKTADLHELFIMNKFDKEIQIVFTKVDSMQNTQIIQNLKKTSNFTKNFKNIRNEIILTSSKKLFGIKDLQAHLALDIQN